jgi:hypothetical protein
MELRRLVSVTAFFSRAGIGEEAPKFPAFVVSSSPFPNLLVQLASPPHRTHTSGGRRAHFPPSERDGLDQGSSHSFSLSCGGRRCCRSCAAPPVFPQNILRQTPEPFPRRQWIRLRAPAGAVPLRSCQEGRVRPRCPALVSDPYASSPRLESPVRIRGACLCRYISWDDYFMAIAFLSAERSKDPNRQVNDICTGYVFAPKLFVEIP